VAEAPYDAALLAIEQRIVHRREPDIETREAFVHALGRAGRREHVAAVEFVIDGDESGYVRAAAWLALSRIDPEHVRTLLAADRPPADAWDRIAAAQARLLIGDTSQVEALLSAAEKGEPGPREVASRALHKGLRPLLEAVGRWPLDADPREGQIWPLELVAEARDRCNALPLRRISDETWPQIAAADRVRFNVRKLTNARDRIARVIFWN
jgi:hypothetical protein